MGFKGTYWDFVGLNGFNGIEVGFDWDISVSNLQ
jgi:hypothetical protein